MLRVVFWKDGEIVGVVKYKTNHPRLLNIRSSIFNKARLLRADLWISEKMA